MLITFIVLYLLVSVGIGLWAARRVNNTTDFALAGRHLPLSMVAIVTFATWFGSELVLGVSAEFVDGGLAAVVKDPFGAGLCLVLVGMFFARRLYQKTLLTLADYYRQRFGKGIEVICSLIIIFSYLGWVAAQITALGLVFNMLSAGAISFFWGMVIGTAVVLIYTMYGGMWSVALTDTIQMIVIVVGLLAVAWYAADLAGGAGRVIDYAASEGKFKMFPDLGDGRGWLFFIASLITMMLGSIPQQDVFQRVMAANNADAAVRGPIIGGTFYIVFGFVPMFIATAAVLILPNVQAIIDKDVQYVLPTLVLQHMPMLLQVAFFGALLSAITSTTASTLLAPSTTFVENILRNIKPGMSDAQTLKAMRLSVPVFTAMVLVYALTMEGKSIYELVAEAYQLPLVGAFVPLVFGLYWQRATTQGAVLSVVFGILVWGAIALSGLLAASYPETWGTNAAIAALAAFGELVPQQLAGVVGAAVAMVVGSLMPQFIADTKEKPHHLDAASPLPA
ncbi:sodium:solute symporter family protein [Vandammella animalimorsus]|uniref:Sodium:solute symporter n=1 Tax=Vandammella animalimorsus TaxID=2029117 RepID=A0A2A2A953_9BURK|nr:sodium:solute symporter family protein [Vandammella animalimorsus]PAT35045.1 sodium:solute symporter [Vandammella animalimorsus]